MASLKPPGSPRPRSPWRWGSWPVPGVPVRGDGDHAPGCRLGACPGNQGLSQPGDEAANLQPGANFVRERGNAGVSSQWTTEPLTQKGEEGLDLHWPLGSHQHYP